MPTLQPRYSPTEFSQRGTAIYESKVRSLLTAQDIGKFVAIDIETETWELDADDYTATERLLQRIPDAQIWLVSVGSQTTYRNNAAQLLIEAKAELENITERRLKLQRAADAAFPYYEKENTALRSESGLPKTRPFRPA